MYSGTRLIRTPSSIHLHMYPIILTSTCRRHNTLSFKGKNFSKYRKVTKTLGGGGGGIQPTNHGGGMSLHVRPRVNLLNHLQVMQNNAGRFILDFPASSLRNPSIGDVKVATTALPSLSCCFQSYGHEWWDILCP